MSPKSTLFPVFGNVRFEIKRLDTFGHFRNLDEIERMVNSK